MRRYTLRTPSANLTVYEADDSQLPTIGSDPAKESTRPTWSASTIEVSAPRNRHLGLETVSNIKTNEELFLLRRRIMKFWTKKEQPRKMKIYCI